MLLSCANTLCFECCGTSGCLTARVIGRIVPGSSAQGCPPPPSAAEEEPPGAEPVEGPSGSVLVYDVRTWHRSGLNRSEQPRQALLNNYLAQWVMPIDIHYDEYRRFAASPTGAAQLTERERADADAIMQPRIRDVPIQAQL